MPETPITSGNHQSALPPEEPSFAPAGRSYAQYWLVGMVACFCAFVLSLPVFPTEDGPIHLYFASILGSLLTHGSPLWAQYYAIHHILPPYSLHYYLLLFLMKAVPAQVAEKVVICFIFTNLAFGFRYLATAIGSAGDVLSLLIVGLLFNWPLGMGFENFSLSLGFACWALGLWTRLQQPLPPDPILVQRVSVSRHLRYRIAFVLLLALMTLTHPVPVLLTLGFAGIDLALRLLAAIAWRAHASPYPRVANLVTWFAGTSTLGYIYLFTDKHRSVEEVHTHTHPLAQFAHYAQLYGLAYFGGTSLLTAVYHQALYVLFFLGLILGMLAAFRQIHRRQWTSQLSWFVAALLFVAAQPFIPVDINGSHLFAERLVVFIWIALLASASGAGKPSPFFRRTLIFFAVLITVIVLTLGYRYIAPVARDQAALASAAVTEQGRIGMLLPGTYDQYTFDENLRFYPYDWAGSTYFRQSSSVMLNTPWMDLPILPITATPRLLIGTVRSTHLENYRTMRGDLIASAGVRSLILPRTDFIFFNDPNRHASQAELDLVLNADPAYQWSCKRPAPPGDWYILCDKIK